jgi:mannitol-specific phosphotransferase system IIBC component
MESNTGTKAGTVGGTLLTICYNIHSEDIAKTVVLAGIGAVVSFVVSLLLKSILKYFKK